MMKSILFSTATLVATGAIAFFVVSPMSIVSNDDVIDAPIFLADAHLSGDPIIILPEGEGGQGEGGAASEASNGAAETAGEAAETAGEAPEAAGAASESLSEASGEG